MNFSNDAAEPSLAESSEEMKSKELEKRLEASRIDFMQRLRPEEKHIFPAARILAIQRRLKSDTAAPRPSHSSRLHSIETPIAASVVAQESLQVDA